MVDEDVALAHRRHHVGRLALVGLQPRLGHGRPRRVAQLRVARDLEQVEEVLEVEQAVDRDDVVLLDAERVHQLLAHRLPHVGGDLDAHDLAEAPPAQLVLDGLQQVVGLVGDGVVGVAGDAEHRVVDDLHAREELVEVGRDQLLERDEGAPVVEPHEAREHLLGHLHAREGLGPGDGVADDDPERERQVGDVGERAAQAHGQRGEHREDLAAEAVVELRALAVVDVRAADDADAVLGERRPQLLVQAARLASVVPAHRCADGVDRLRRRATVLQRGLEPRLDLVVQAGHADHDELVEVRGDDRAELHPLEQRDARVLGELEHARVELQPRELAVEVELMALEVDLRDGLRGRGSRVFDVSHSGALLGSGWRGRRDPSSRSAAADRDAIDRGRRHRLGRDVGVGLGLRLARARLRALGDRERRRARKPLRS